MSLGTYRPVEKVQPGWLIAAGPVNGPLAERDEWVEIRAIFDYQDGKREFRFTDGSKTFAVVGDEVRCLTNAETALRREALGEEKASA